MSYRSINYSQPPPVIAIAVNGLTAWTIVEEKWNYQVRNRAFPCIIWLRTPSKELREIVLSRMACFPPKLRREEWLCPKPEGVE